jgi:hypothetical protein
MRDGQCPEEGILIALFADSHTAEGIDCSPHHGWLGENKATEGNQAHRRHVHTRKKIKQSPCDPIQSMTHKEKMRLRGGEEQTKRG